MEPKEEVYLGSVLENCVFKAKDAGRMVLSTATGGGVFCCASAIGLVMLFGACRMADRGSGPDNKKYRKGESHLLEPDRTAHVRGKEVATRSKPKGSLPEPSHRAFPDVLKKII